MTLCMTKSDGYTFFEKYKYLEPVKYVPFWSFLMLQDDTVGYI